VSEVGSCIQVTFTCEYRAAELAHALCAAPPPNRTFSAAFTQESRQGTSSIPDFSGIWVHHYGWHELNRSAASDAKETFIGRVTIKGRKVGNELRGARA